MIARRAAGWMAECKRGRITIRSREREDRISAGGNSKNGGKNTEENEYSINSRDCAERYIIRMLIERDDGLLAVESRTWIRDK